MPIEAYREYLQGRNVPDDRIEEQMAIVRDLVAFLIDCGLGGTAATAGKTEAEAFARRLTAKGRNTLIHLQSLPVRLLPARHG